MAGKIKKTLLTSALLIAVVLAAIGFGLLPVNLFFTKSAISEFVAEELGMELEIHGPLRIRFGPTPGITASGITFRFPGTDDEPLLQIGQLAIKPRLVDLLDGDVFLRSISAENLELDYCQSGPPADNSAADSPVELGSIPSMAIDRLRIQGLLLLCSNEDRMLEFLPDQLDIKVSAPLKGPMEASVAGLVDEEKISLTLTGGSLGNLLQDPASFPFDLNLTAHHSELSAKGSISTPLSMPELTANGTLVSDRMRKLAGISSLSLGVLARGFASRPYFELDIQLEQIDLKLLSDATEESEDSGNPFEIRLLNEVLTPFDARAKIRIGQLLNAPLPVDELVLEAGLEKSVLDISKAEWRVAGSPATAEASLDMNSNCALLNSHIRISDFQLDQLNRFLGDDASLGGHLDSAEVGSSSCGNTVLEHLESLQMTVAGTGITGIWDEEKLPMSVNSLQAEINWNQTGRLTFDGQLLGETLSASIGFGSIASIQSGSHWPLNIEARSDTAQLKLAGEARILEDKLDLDVSMNFETDRFGSLHAWIGSDPKNDLTFRGRTKLEFGEEGLSLNNLDLALGSSDIRGSLTWAGADKDLPLVIDLRSSNLDLKELSGLFPEKEETEQAEKLQWAELLTQSDWLEEWLEFPPLNIDLSAKHVSGIKFDLNDADLHVNLRDRQIEDGRLGFRHEDIAIEGTLEADLRERPWSVAYDSVFSNIDIGRVLAAFDLTDNIDAKAQRMSTQITSQGQTLKQLAENSRTESKIENLHWVIEAGPENQPREIDLSSLELSTAPSLPSTWSASGFLNGVPIRAWMKTPSLQSTFNPTAQLPLTLVIGAGDDITMLNAVIDRPDSAGSRIDLSISGEFTDPENADFSQLEAPLKDYHFRSDVTIKENELLFSQLQAQIGTSQATGEISIRYEEPIYDFDVDINAPFLETDDLVHWVEEWRNTRQMLAAESPAESDSEAKESPAERDAEAEESGILVLISQSVDELAGNNNIDLSISIDELRSAGLLLGDTRFKLRMDETEILIDPLHIALPDGKVELRYHGKDAGAGVELTLDIDIERLSYGGLLRLLDPDTEAQGELFIESSLVSRAPDFSQSVNHLEGTFAMALFPEDINAEFLDIWASNLIFALLPGGESDKKMNCMVAVFEVENGNMKSKTTFLDSTDVIVRARGDIDLVNRQLDLLIAPQSKREKFLSVSAPIKVKGPFSDFTVAVAPGGFVMSMVRMYYGLIYVPWKWLTGERFPADGIATCYSAMGWKIPENGH